MSLPSNWKENTMPGNMDGLANTGNEKSRFDAPDTDGRESPQGYTHPAFFKAGPVRIEKNYNPLCLDPLGRYAYEFQTETPTSPLTARPRSHEESYWPLELLHKHFSPEKHHRTRAANNQTFTDLSISESPTSSKRPAPDGKEEQVSFVRPKIKRMLSFRSVDADEIFAQVPDKLRYDREIQLWCSDIIKNGATMASIQDGLGLFSHKMGQSKPNSMVLNTFSVYLDSTIAQLVEVKSFYEQYHRHILQRENEKLHAENKELHTKLEKQSNRIKDLEWELKHGMEL
ncbi:hypothetical protein ABW20_dc0100887 [Dactylellina cionopaga]|nr:hypothetical protein ABW20_dc0100887 [Dactylellina cionopaga]